MPGGATPSGREQRTGEMALQRRGSPHHPSRFLGRLSAVTGNSAESARDAPSIQPRGSRRATVRSTRSQRRELGSREAHQPGPDNPETCESKLRKVQLRKAGRNHRGPDYCLLVRIVRDEAEPRKATVRRVRGSFWFLPPEILGALLKQTDADPEGKATRTRACRVTP